MSFVQEDLNSSSCNRDTAIVSEAKIDIVLGTRGAQKGAMLLFQNSTRA